MNWFQRFVMRRGVKLFCDFVPSRTITFVWPGVDHINFRNRVMAMAAITGSGRSL